MTDFNNNIGSDKINQVSSTNFGSGKVNSDYQPASAHKEIKNLDNAHSALVGRSMVKKMDKAELNFDSKLVANIKEDLAAFKGNERIVGLSDKIFDAAIKKGYSYEDATKLQQEAVEYFKQA